MATSSFTITFRDGFPRAGGNEDIYDIISLKEIQVGVTRLVVPSPPSHDGYGFVGWSRDPSSDDVVDVDELVAELSRMSYKVEDFTLYSVYKVAFKVQFIDSFTDELLSQQWILDDGTAMSPAFPVHGMYVAFKWDKPLDHLTGETTFYPIYVNVTNMLRTLKGHYVINNLKDVVAIQNSLHNIFTWIPGERILLPEFGSNLRKLLYEGITDFNVERIISEIRSSVSEWEPRVEIQKIVNVSTDDDTDDNTVHLEVLYKIPGLEGLENEVFAYDLEYQKG